MGLLTQRQQHRLGRLLRQRGTMLLLMMLLLMMLLLLLLLLLLQTAVRLGRLRCDDALRHAELLRQLWVLLLVDALRNAELLREQLWVLLLVEVREVGRGG